MSKHIKSKLETKNLKPEDRTKINININDSNQIISPYCEDNNAIINAEFANFLDNSVKDVSIKQNLSIEISASDCDINKVSTAIKNYYHNEYVDTQRKLKHNLTGSIVTLIIGLLALSLAIVLNSNNTPIIVGYALDIFAWVFVWEAVDLFFFKRVELKYIKHRQINFINANIILK